MMKIHVPISRSLSLIILSAILWNDSCSSWNGNHKKCWMVISMTPKELFFAFRGWCYTNLEDGLVWYGPFFIFSKETTGYVKIKVVTVLTKLFRKEYYLLYIQLLIVFKIEGCWCNLSVDYGCVVWTLVIFISFLYNDIQLHVGEKKDREKMTNCDRNWVKVNIRPGCDNHKELLFKKERWVIYK
jgi:hypothetical protein